IPKSHRGKRASHPDRQAVQAASSVPCKTWRGNSLLLKFLQKTEPVVRIDSIVVEITIGMEQSKFIPTRRSLLSRLKDWDNEDSWRDFFNTYWRLIYDFALKAG